MGHYSVQVFLLIRSVRSGIKNKQDYVCISAVVKDWSPVVPQHFYVIDYLEKLTEWF
jgi:hypothetical protein